MKPPVPVGPLLIVDDEEPVVKFVDRVLRDAGYKTVTASNGPEAIETAKRIGPLGALVTDVMMPGMTGDELARHSPADRAESEGAVSDRLQRSACSRKRRRCGTTRRFWTSRAR